MYYRVITGVSFNQVKIRLFPDPQSVHFRSQQSNQHPRLSYVKQQYKYVGSPWPQAGSHRLCPGNIQLVTAFLLVPQPPSSEDSLSSGAWGGGGDGEI